MRIGCLRHSTEDVMTADDQKVAGPFGPMSRRAAIGSAPLAGAFERIGGRGYWQVLPADAH